MTDASLPIVGIPACVKRINDFFDFHAVGESFVAAVAEGANALPLIIPALGDWHNPQALVKRIDGLLLTGSPSNIEPHHYQGEASAPDTIHDPKRDATTLPLIRAAVAAGVPVLAICRGLQELNVALGGTLYQNVHEVPGRFDHRSDKSKPIAERFGPLPPGAPGRRRRSCRARRQHGDHGQFAARPGHRPACAGPGGGGRCAGWHDRSCAG
jgi:putative glutamine amidotransferase